MKSLIEWWWLILWALACLYLWGRILMERPRGIRVKSLGQGRMSELDIITSSRAYSICQLRSMGRGAFVYARPDFWLLSPEEAWATLQHETAHWRLRHVEKRLVIAHLWFLLFMWGASELPTWWLSGAWFLAWYWLGMFIIGLIWRGHEYEADELAARTCDRRALMKAIGSITRDWTARGAFHPSVHQRMKALGVDAQSIASELGRGVVRR